MTFDILKLLVEILKAIAWPLVAFSVIFILRKKLPMLADSLRAVTIGKEGLTATLVAHEAVALQVEAKPVETKPALEAGGDLRPELAQRLKEVRNLDVSPIVQEQQNLIRADIETLQISQPELSEILIKQLAVAQLGLRAEYTYRTIFGSQIAALRAVNTKGPHTRTQIQQFYEEAKAKFPELYDRGPYSFEQYLHYLTSQGLLIENNLKPGEYAITVAGKAFLGWLSENGITGDKAF